MFHFDHKFTFFGLPAANTLFNASLLLECGKRLKRTSPVSTFSIQLGFLTTRIAVRQKIPAPPVLIYNKCFGIGRKFRAQIVTRLFILSVICQAASGWSFEANWVAAAASRLREREGRVREGRGVNVERAAGANRREGESWMPESRGEQNRKFLSKISQNLLFLEVHLHVRFFKVQFWFYMSL
jgi:hypothetical protein